MEYMLHHFAVSNYTMHWAPLMHSNRHDAVSSESEIAHNLQLQSCELHYHAHQAILQLEVDLGGHAICHTQHGITWPHCYTNWPWSVQSVPKVSSMGTETRRWNVPLVRGLLLWRAFLGDAKSKQPQASSVPTYRWHGWRWIGGTRGHSRVTWNSQRALHLRSEHNELAASRTRPKTHRFLADHNFVRLEGISGLLILDQRQTDQASSLRSSSPYQPSIRNPKQGMQLKSFRSI